MLRRDNFFLPESFFDLSSFPYAKLFLKQNPVWESVSAINPFISSLFLSGKIRGNYSKDIYVGQNCVIDSTAKIIGPVIICDGVRVGFNALIRGSVIIGVGSVIGHSVEIKNSVVLNSSSISHFNYVGDSILGNRVNFGAGSITANLRLDNKPVSIKILGKEKIETGLKKLGSIIGDDAKVGAHVVLNPGTLLAKNTFIYPLLNISGYNSGVVKK